MAVLLWIFYISCGLGGGLGTLFLVYTLYITYVHWKYSHLPSPRRSSFYAGHLPDYWQTRREVDKEASMDRAVKYWSEGVDSDTFVVFFYHLPIVYTMDPAVVKDVMMNSRNERSDRFQNALASVFGNRFMGKGLVTIQGYEEWKKHRKLYDPAFSMSYLKTLTPTFNEITSSAIDELKQLADGKTKVPLKKYITQVTMDIISEVAFGMNFSKIWTAKSLGVEIPRDLNIGLLLFLINTSLEGLQRAFVSFYPPINPYLHPIDGKKYQQAVLALRKIGRDCIIRRIEMIKNGEEMPRDILTHMLSNNSETASIEELVDDFITFYVGGLETTANAVMFSIILLCLHPNTLERLQQEVKEVLEGRTTVTSKDLENLKYTEQVLFEALRMYSPTFGIPKCLHSSLTFQNSTIPAGTEVIVVSMDYKSQYHEDPDSFNPDRFHSDHKRPSPFVFFPFGVGNRACIGKHLAIMEGKTVLARLFQTFTIAFPEDYEIKVIERLTRQPKDDLLCTLTLN